MEMPEITLKPQHKQILAAIHQAQNYLLRWQHPSGYWVGMLEADASVTAGYIPLMVYLFGWVDPERKRKAITYVLDQQNPDGSWSTHYAGPGDLDVSIQCYFGLKLGGVSADNPTLQRGREFILSRGGLTQANVFTKIWLAVFGAYDYRGVPSIPPEIIYFSEKAFFNIYEFASWSRETLMALIILLACKPVCQIPEKARVDELYCEAPGKARRRLAPIGNPFSWRGFFALADRLLKIYESFPIHPGRANALRRVEAWIVEHQEADGSWGGILLPWIYSLYALKGLGYPLDHPVFAKGIEGFEDFLLEDERTLRFQPATSPVWDTAWTVFALRESGLPADHRSLMKAGEWLLQKEIRMAGDWHVKNPGIPPGGWSFEFVNDWYPDLDDSALVPRALLRTGLSGEAVLARSAAVKRAVDWVLGMQSKDGGWGAFDRDNDLQPLTQVPFADFLSPLDPTCPDVTAHVLEFLAEVQQGESARQKGIAYIKKVQQEDGCWYGRWGVNYLYGTSLVLSGLAAASEDMHQPYIRRAVEWLLAHQNADGGWGESCLTYSDPSLRGQGASTASQTGWVLNGLLAAGEKDHPSISQGVAYLLATQKQDGDWEEPFFTGTGFPRVFYLRYDLYRVYFPLIALARYFGGLESPDARSDTTNRSS